MYPGFFLICCRRRGPGKAGELAATCSQAVSVANIEWPALQKEIQNVCRQSENIYKVG
jgi:hypothetical protein